MPTPRKMLAANVAVTLAALALFWAGLDLPALTCAVVGIGLGAGTLLGYRGNPR